MSEPLKPCPFCGRSGMDLGEIDQGKSWQVYCRCGAMGPTGTEDGACEAWNTRPGPRGKA